MMVFVLSFGYRTDGFWSRVEVGQKFRTVLGALQFGDDRVYLELIQFVPVVEQHLLELLPAE